MTGSAYLTDGETPAHPVTLAAYFLDATAVTNAQFATFVKATGHVTEAEEIGVSAVFHSAVRAARADVVGTATGTPWWTVVQAPTGGTRPARPDAGDLANHPVVHVTWRDAQAYCRWAGKRLPTEAEREHAARGWPRRRAVRLGRRAHPARALAVQHLARLPRAPTRSRTVTSTTAPVRTFAPNGHGLHNMAGNVWSGARTASPTTYADRVTAAAGFRRRSTRWLRAATTRDRGPVARSRG